MSVLVVGLSHRSAPVPLLERAAVSGDALTKLLRDTYQARHVAEAMVVSTCNRVEIYAEVDKFHGGVSSVSELFARYSEVGLDRLAQHLYVHYEDRAVQHLFAVVCGLDSMVVGESQILGQVRSALRLAQHEHTVGRALNEFVQHALRVGKRAHTETGIDRAGLTLVSVGLEAAERRLDTLSGRRALVVGAGSMSALAATTLARTDAAEITVANRTYGRAKRLAASVNGRAVPMEQLADALAEADLVVSCTGATGLVIRADLVAAAAEIRRGRPLHVLDLALPRDVDPAVRDLPGVTLTNLEELGDEAGGPEHTASVEAVRRIVAEEVAAFLSDARAARVAPTVVALRSRAAEVVEAELARLAGRLPEIDGRSREEIARSMRRVVDKLLHAPTVRVKELAGAPGGDSYAAALRELFDLDPKAPEAVASADVTVEEEETA
ncbi:MAG: glutamyl-tRNA reductase [Streptosporangiales bacterium]|nr:glutamyl-tRNA reductase [Streptosporangiales bacterium]